MSDSRTHFQLMFYYSVLARLFYHLDSERRLGARPPAGTGSAILDYDGRRMILPGGESQISVLDRQGNVMARWHTRSGHGLCVDSRGDVYLAAQSANAIDKYIRQA